MEKSLYIGPDAFRFPLLRGEQGEERESKLIRRFQSQSPILDWEVKERYSLETDAEMQYMPLS